MQMHGAPAPPVPPMSAEIRTQYPFLLPHLDVSELPHTPFQFVFISSGNNCSVSKLGSDNCFSAQRTAKMQPLSATYFMGETLRTEMLARQRAVLLQPEIPGGGPASPSLTAIISCMSHLYTLMTTRVAGGVPAELDNYHSIYPLEPVPVDGSPPTPGKVFGFQSMLYKGVSDEDGLPYVLRRLDGVRVTDSKAMSRVDAWKAVRSCVHDVKEFCPDSHVRYRDGDRWCTQT